MFTACANVPEEERFEQAEEEMADLSADIKGSVNKGVVTRDGACFVPRGPESPRMSGLGEQTGQDQSGASLPRGSGE